MPVRPRRRRPTREPGPPRAVVERVRPEIDAGEAPVKRSVGETLDVEADAFTDGHDLLSVRLLYRRVGQKRFSEAPMEDRGNDLYVASLELTDPGFWEYTVAAWIDRFGSWVRDLAKRSDAGSVTEADLAAGAALLREAAARAAAGGRAALLRAAAALGGGEPLERRTRIALDPALLEAAGRAPDRRLEARYPRVLRAWVDRERARTGAWYEFFPRSAGTDPSRGATLREAEARLPAIAAMGFDVVYLPPIHPIGRTDRKGPGNRLTAGPGDPGSPWAIGGPEGGHKAVDPGLGTVADFAHFVRAAAGHGLEVALDLAFQCSPDHPYVKDHPEWFRHRPDGSIQYAENPPKKYQDIFPFDFECPDWRALWSELRSVVFFWIERGVRIFRVDNPHTKPFRFWRWLIAEVQKRHPDVIFLSEAFTRPKVMKHLAKQGFSQSYTYFTWRNTKEELTEYFTELTRTEVGEYLRPNLFTNTPDILHEYLQYGGPAAFQARLVLAATLGASYGIYGPAFELCEGRAIPGTEEYEESEKYQVRVWDHDRSGNIRDLVTRVNAARRGAAALRSDRRLAFHRTDNDQLLFYSKSTPDLRSIVAVVVNLDPHHMQHGWVEVPLAEFGLSEHEVYQMHDVLGEGRFLWRGSRNYVRLDPSVRPAHLFILRRRVKTEKDFDYYL